MLIRHATLENGDVADVRIESGIVTAIGRIAPRSSEDILEANGGLLLPGLHDHHIHIAALAASLNSVHCGPPDVTNNDEFAARLQRPGRGWLRATGYHESVAGMLDAAALDRIVPDRPVRVQHRSGRLWFLNSPALDTLLSSCAAPDALERNGRGYTGRLIDADAWLQQAIGSMPPSFAEVGSMLARYGITGVTEISPNNGPLIAEHFLKETSSQALPQQVLLAGSLQLSNDAMSSRVKLGPAKLHLHEAHLPPLDDAVAFIRRAHGANRGVAIHCATEVELIFALAAFEEGGTIIGDRIEHAAIAVNSVIDDIARAGIAVVTQPHFIHERGDRYLRDVDEIARPHLYRLRAFLDANVTLAAGSDAPFGGCDPWASMTVAIRRRTRSGEIIGEAEALTPEQALDVYLRDPQSLSHRRRVTIGLPADLCLLDCSWAQARTDFSSNRVRATLMDGRVIYDRAGSDSQQRCYEEEEHECV